MSAIDSFNSWLTAKLGSYDIEDEVMGSYISSIITTDEADADKIDSLRDILLDLLNGVDVEELCSEIISKWNECHQITTNAKNDEKEQFDLGHKVALIMGMQVQPVLKPVNRSSEEEQLREAILTRCRFVSSDEEECDSDEGASSSFQPSASQNQNAEAVAQAERERRETLKSESDKKKASDKVNREKQKQKQEERREKERKRTQKQERRR